MDKRLKVRHPIGAQLVEGQDDDLIAWYKSLAPGNRQTVIKNLLRAALGMEIPAPPPAFDAEALMQNARVEIAAIIAEQIATLHRTPATVSDPAIDQRLKAVESWLADDLPKYLQGEVSKALATGTPPPSAPGVEGGAQLDASAIEKRAKRLKGSQW